MATTVVYGGCPEFARVPKELQLRIWDATMEPKFLRIGIGERARTVVSTWSPQGNPVALRVCVASRQRALEHYVLRIHLHRDHQDIPADLRDAVRYIDPEHDIVFINPSFEAATATSAGKWGRINMDFGLLKKEIMQRAEYDPNTQKSQLVGAARRIALPYRWWRLKCANMKDIYDDVSSFALLFFSGFREIHIVAECDSIDDELQAVASADVAKDCAAAHLDSLLPISMRPELANLGWHVEEVRENRAIRVTHEGHSTTIFDFSRTPLGGIDLAMAPATPGHEFCSLAPGLDYPYVPRRFGPVPPPPRGSMDRLFRRVRGRGASSSVPQDATRRTAEREDEGSAHRD
ncbi:hypothetical protein VPNG_02745 [Cytospora leucostoma]|uniref:2EXR domain-containing protein n=1 Tax=Cytospora leucostoma TaxID=1230097 RepID=A0A423XIZ5_9PEZI|nr:hypothetical protein VPNG_02745 [Cytospora leucostoma]